MARFGAIEVKVEAIHHGDVVQRVSLVALVTEVTEDLKSIS